jgi:hypothetical protein
MKIYGKCNSCENENGFWSNSSTRVQFAMNEGEIKKITCKNCNANNEIHVDELYAKKSKLAQILAGLMLIVGTPLTLFFILPALSGTRNNYLIYIIGGLLLVPVIIYGMMNKQDQTRVSSFNRNKLKGRVPNIG